MASTRKTVWAWPALLSLAVLAVLAAGAQAVDVPARNSAPEHRSVREARVLIEQKRWAPAERLLAAHVRAEPQDADAHNLLGFSLRNLGRLQESLVAYRRALELDPAHLGAHEYIGEVYVQLGNLAQARVHLDALTRLCPTGCAELDDLRASLDKAQSAAGRPGLMRSTPSSAPR